jgi:hypothetical protein
MVAETVLIVIITASVAVTGLVARLLYNSKCSEVTCCFGACTCKRNVEKEITLQVDTSTRNIKP